MNPGDIVFIKSDPDKIGEVLSYNSINKTVTVGLFILNQKKSCLKFSSKVEANPAFFHILKPFKLVESLYDNRN